jgi:hypothetical protein
VAPADSIALIGQYFVAESSMERRIAASDRPAPPITCTSSISV